MVQKKHYAALMGDLVDSEKQLSQKSLHDLFNRTIEQHNSAFAALLASPLTITLGDEFQGLTNSLIAAAEIAREIRFTLMEHGLDCRFAIGIVTLESPLNTGRAWNMMGQGLSDTRKKLNEKREGTLYRFFIPQNPALEIVLEASGASLTAIERSWTKTQKHDIPALLRGRTALNIASDRNVSVHSVYKVRNSGNFDLYQIHWNAIKEAFKYLDDEFRIGA
jgi:hypothetical protein